MDTTYVMECGEVSCEYCNKDRCIKFNYIFNTHLYASINKIKSI